MPPSQIMLLANYLEMYNWQINQIRKEDTSFWSKKFGPVMLFLCCSRRKRILPFNRIFYNTPTLLPAVPHLSHVAIAMQAGEQSSQFIIILKVVDACVLVLCDHYLPPDQITPDCWRFCNSSIGPR